VTSGTFSPALQLGVGIGFINDTFKDAGSKIFFGDEKNTVSASLVKRPFYKNGSLKA